MNIKTFYAKTMTEALHQIKEALGPDALLLSTREIPRSSGVGSQACGFEVVAASDESVAPVLVGSASSPRHEPAEALLSAQLQEPDRGLPERDVRVCTYSPATLARPAVQAPRKNAGSRKTPVKRTAAKTPSKSSASDSPFSDAPSLGLYRDLMTSGVEEWLARKLLLDAKELVVPRQRRSRSSLLHAAGRAAQALISAPASLDGTPARRVVVFVGPTGVGKTTSMAKLAARLALQQKKKITLMTLDGYRIGAVEQLRTYAGLMGIPFRFVSQAADLARAVREQAQRDFILIDTTGRSPRDLSAMQDLAEYLQTSDQVERHLVLSATTKASDMCQIVDRFEVCRPDHLLFTKLDETSTLGPVLNELVRSRKSMSYYTDGQRVPEDFHPALAEQIVDIVLNKN